MQLSLNLSTPQSRGAAPKLDPQHQAELVQVLAQIMTKAVTTDPCRGTMPDRAETADD